MASLESSSRMDQLIESEDDDENHNEIEESKMSIAHTLTNLSNFDSSTKESTDKTSSLAEILLANSVADASNAPSVEISSAETTATAASTNRIIKRKFNQDAVEVDISKTKVRNKPGPKPSSKLVKPNRQSNGHATSSIKSTTTSSSTVLASDMCSSIVLIPPPVSYQPPLSAPSLLLSMRDKSKGLTLSKDQLTCYGSEGGFKMIRATHGVHSGSYYFEVQILDTPLSSSSSNQASSSLPSTVLPQYNSIIPSINTTPTSSTTTTTTNTPHYRIGWASRQAELEGPLGYDKYGYAYRDISVHNYSLPGSKIHQSQRDDNYGQSYGPGDVIGCFIRLDDRGEVFTGASSNSNNTNTSELQYANNEIRFFKNGQHQGVAFSGFPMGLFFPAISIYTNGAIAVNFGPSFIYKHDMPSLNAKNPVSEIQPMNPSDRKLHEIRIAQIRQSIADRKEQEQEKEQQRQRKEQQIKAQELVITPTTTSTTAANTAQSAT